MPVSGKPCVLITGGAGYIGSHVVLALLDNGWPVAVIDNLCTGFRHLVPQAATFIEGDIADTNLVTKILEQYNIRAILHFAGSLIVSESVTDPLKYYSNNTGNTCSLIRAAIAAQVSHFVFSSTAAVYGITDAKPVPESTNTAPINPYGRSKLMSEFMLHDASIAHHFNYGILRYFNVAGADPQGRSGQCTRDATSLIKVAVEAALQKRDCVNIFGNDYATPDGTGVRDYIHVTDLASAHVSMLEELIKNPTRSHILNCGYNKGHSVYEVIDCVDRLTESKITRVVQPRRHGDPDSVTADNAAILRTLAWHPVYTQLEMLIADSLRWERHLAVTTTTASE